MSISRPVRLEQGQGSEQEAIETILYDRLPHNRVQCTICQRRCVLSEDQRGYCGTRVNREGHVYSLIYERVSTIMVSPIEKDPLFHYYPASDWLFLGDPGCNFQCPGCQNWDVAHLDLSQVPPTPIGVLEKAREIGLEEGLEYVYLGNVHGHAYENTYCPRCGNLLIRRDGFRGLGKWHCSWQV